MTETDNILLDIKHRPFELPKGKWKYYQEWNKALFLHWAIPLEILKEIVPKQLNIDTIDGNAYVSLVAFTMEKIRPRNLFSLQCISNFEEINIRTYIENDNKKGVYFLNIEAQKSLSVYIAKHLSGLPYEKANLTRTNSIFKSKNTKKGYFFDTEFEIKEQLSKKTALDKWLTERYCLYMDINEKYYRYDIHHKEWALKNVNLKHLQLNYTMQNLHLTSTPNLVHYADGVKVLAWKKRKI